MRVKRKDLQRFFDIADLYFCSFGNMLLDDIEFMDKFIKKYKLEKE